ncbi:MAG: AI-2E family transporter [Marvinbryantia sp.]|jgi:sporulation integral membrane protein YtvI
MRISFKNSITIVGIALAVFLGMKYVLPVVIPFLLAWGLVWLLLPPAVWMEKNLHIKKIWGGGILLMFLIAALGIVLYFLGSQLFLQIGNLMTNMDNYMGRAEIFVDNCCQMIEKNTGIHAATVQRFIYENMELLEEQVQVYAVPDVLKNSLAYLMGFVKWLGVVLIVFVSFMMILKDYDEMREALNKYGISERMKKISSAMQSLGGAWLRAQALIILLVMVICTVGLWLLGYPYALLMGIVVGLLDALPFIGTGTILLPWALFLMFTGDFWYGVCLVLIFLAANTMREYLEPKLIGDRIGVYPIVMVAAVYIGLYVYGIAGVVLGPVSLMLIIEIWHEIRAD